MPQPWTLTQILPYIDTNPPRFVTLGPPRGCPTVPGGRRGGGGRPRGVRGDAPATVTEGAGPATGRDAAPKTRLDASEFAAKSKTARRFVT
jgi:hypothetical protein